MNVVSPVYLTVVCLANSRKHGGRCVAGKVIGEPGGPYWIRPVSARPDGSLSLGEIRLPDGTLPQPLDIIQVPVRHYPCTDYQVENVLIDPRQRWRKIGRYPAGLAELADDARDVWLSGASDCRGVNDRVPAGKADFSSSLVLVRPSRLVMRVVHGFEKKAVRARFCFKGVWYDLKVTDPALEARYLGRPVGDEEIDARPLSLCVSLGRAFGGYVYKLVAGVIGL